MVRVCSGETAGRVINKLIRQHLFPGGGLRRGKMQHLAKNSKTFFAIIELLVKLGFGKNVIEASRLALTGMFCHSYVYARCVLCVYAAF